jgi:hypothetical protein
VIAGRGSARLLALIALKAAALCGAFQRSREAAAEHPAEAATAALRACQEGFGRSRTADVHRTKLSTMTMVLAVSKAGEPRRQRSTKPGAIRMARLFDRRRRGFRCFVIEICQADINALVARGFLDRMRRDDPGAIERAIGAVLDRL